MFGYETWIIFIAQNHRSLVLRDISWQNIVHMFKCDKLQKTILHNFEMRTARKIFVTGDYRANLTRAISFFKLFPPTTGGSIQMPNRNVILNK